MSVRFSRVIRVRRSYLAAALLAGAILISTFDCQRNLAFSPPEDSVEGKWGGDGIRFAVETSFATLLFNCGSGVIRAPVIPDAHGRFEVTGTYTSIPGGRAFRALYRGATGGTSMTLTVVLPDEDLVIGPYTLKYGDRGRIEPCGDR